MKLLCGVVKVAALAVLLGGVVAQTAWAGPSYLPIAPTSFRLVQGSSANCFISTTDVQQSAGGVNYEWVMGDPAGAVNCIIATPFTMSVTNTLPSVSTILFTADGQNTSNRYCYKSVIELSSNKAFAAGNVQGWANLTGGFGTSAVTSITGASGAYTDQSTTSSTPITARLVSGPSTSADCTGTNCNTLPGMLFIERCQCGVDANCAAGTDAGGNDFLENIQVKWTAP